MHLVSFFDGYDGGPWLGSMDGGLIQPLGRAGARLEFEKLFSDGQASLSKLAPVGDAIDEDAVTLALPFSRTNNFICVGLNFRDHAREGGHDIPDYPALFMRNWHSLVPHGQPLVAPALSERFDYEAELVVVIGKRSKRLTRDDALDAVFGYTIFNDGSVRDYQRKGAQWTPGKNFDRTGGLGPAIVIAGTLPPGAQGLSLRTIVDGEVLQSGNTSDMIFSVADILVTISQFMTLEPGDMIAMGTPAGVGFARKPPVWLRPGMECKVEIEAIGTLTNSIISESESAGVR